MKRDAFAAIRWLTFLMFTMFAMTTDSVGVVIPRIIEEFKLSMTEAGAFHYAPMTAIGLAGVLLGFLADRLGRRRTVLLGLVLFALNSFLFSVGNAFVFFVGLLTVSGVAIGVFKTGALALIGDISRSTAEHTSTMNMVEGFFGVGAIIGPAVVARLLESGVSWKWLYVIAGSICVVLIAVTSLARFPETRKAAEQAAGLGRTAAMMRDPFALAFSVGAFLYVSVECAIYVWMPTLLRGYHGRFGFMAAYAISIFFVLRAGGRFLGAWVIARYDWSAVLAVFGGLIFACFTAAVTFGVEAAVVVLPLSGLFMSVMYPTLNSKGISCFPKSGHGAAAGVILFFTCAGAAAGPLAMGVVSDLFGHPRYGFVLATIFAGVLAGGLILNYMFQPARALLERLDASEYRVAVGE